MAGLPAAAAAVRVPRRLLRTAGGPLVAGAGRSLAEGGALHARMAAVIPARREEVRRLRAEHGAFPLSTVTVDAAYGGMRGVRGLVYETSLLDAEEGIRFRGLSIPEVQARLPRAEEKGAEQPLPEALFWLLLTGEVPSADEARAVRDDWAQRASKRPLPPAVVRLVRACAPLHPMTQLAVAVNALQGRSVFAAAHAAGRLAKDDAWTYALDDACELIAALPAVVRLVYANAAASCPTDARPAHSDSPAGTRPGVPSKSGDSALPSGPGSAPKKTPRKVFAEMDAAVGASDWSARIAHGLGLDGLAARDMVRMYMCLHADHEGGNVSAHAVHLVGSALSDPFLAFAAGVNGLAGPLHGLAAQDVLVWLESLLRAKGDAPSDARVAEHIWETLRAGRVVPGYGHAVLRRTDPRFAAQAAFAARHVPDAPLVRLVAQVARVAPAVLGEHGRTRNPWPNVDAHSGALLHAFGVTQRSCYTVLFAASRALGALAGLVWDRALGLPIERPKSLTTAAIREICAKGAPQK